MTKLNADEATPRHPKALLAEERPWRCTRFYPCRYMNAEQCAHDTALGSECPKVCACPCHKDFPNCEHESVGHNDGPDCAVCELSVERDALRAAVKRAEWDFTALVEVRGDLADETRAHETLRILRAALKEGE